MPSRIEVMMTSGVSFESIKAIGRAVDDHGFARVNAGQDLEVVANSLAGLDQAKLGLAVQRHERDLELASLNHGAHRHPYGGELTHRYGGAAELAGAQARVNGQIDLGQERPAARVRRRRDLRHNTSEILREGSHAHAELAALFQAVEQGFGYTDLEPQPGGILDLEERPAGGGEVAHIGHLAGDHAVEGCNNPGIG
jgi:hypothetical protein